MSESLLTESIFESRSGSLSLEHWTVQVYDGVPDDTLGCSLIPMGLELLKTIDEQKTEGVQLEEEEAMDCWLVFWTLLLRWSKTPLFCVITPFERLLIAFEGAKGTTASSTSTTTTSSPSWHGETVRSKAFLLRCGGNTLGYLRGQLIGFFSFFNVF